jgi:hypothetical protein
VGKWLDAHIGAFGFVLGMLFGTCQKIRTFFPSRIHPGTSNDGMTVARKTYVYEQLANLHQAQDL